jgi:hypothetical protein
MYEKQVKTISTIINEIKEKERNAYSFIQDIVSGASTSLEYYGMLNQACIEAEKKGLIPKIYKSKLKKIDKAVKEIYTI